MDRNNSHTQLSLPLLDGFRPFNEFEARKAVKDIVTCKDEIYIRFAGSKESLQQVNKEHPTTMIERCRIICEEMGLEKNKTVSRELKYEIAKNLMRENLCPYEDFHSKQRQYHDISTMLAKLYYSDKTHRSVLPTR